MDLILRRRSIRRYTEEEVSAEDVTSLLRAAMSAPSAHNQQPWHFVVLRERSILDEIPRHFRYGQMLKKAPAAILVCGDPSLARSEGYWVQDCAAATQNILLAAQALGLGAVWVGTYPRKRQVKKMRELLGIPEHVIPFALVPIGHPAEEKEAADRYKPERIHYERWEE